MITRALTALKQVFIPKSEFEEENIEGAIDGDPIDCVDLQENYSEHPYIGVPAPDYLPEDPWFPVPVLSEKQMTVKEAHEQAVADQQILDESENKESEDIHQKLYQLATANWNTVGETQLSSQGGSENFQEGPGGWTSGTGLNQFSH